MLATVAAEQSKSPVALRAVIRCWALPILGAAGLQTLESALPKAKTGNPGNQEP